MTLVPEMKRAADDVQMARTMSKARGDGVEGVEDVVAHEEEVMEVRDQRALAGGNGRIPPPC